jgi:D-alanine-D-alanine ligase
VKVLIIYSAAPETLDSGRRAGEFDLVPAVRGITDVLPEASVARVSGEPREILAALETHAPGVVYNLCEAPLGRPDLEAHVASLLEWAGVRFTGSGSETIALCRRKDRVTAVLADAGIPVPRASGFPCIVKPADQDGSVFIHHDSVCEDSPSVTRALERLTEPVVIQEFLPGREFAVTLWGRIEPEHVSIGETKFLKGLRLITYPAKWETGSEDFANSPFSYDFDLDADLTAAIVAMARAAWRAVGARGYLGLDVRLDASGAPKILDVNPNPDPGPEMHRAVLHSGWTWKRFVQAQVAWA